MTTRLRDPAGTATAEVSGMALSLPTASGTGIEGGEGARSIGNGMRAEWRSPRRAIVSRPVLVLVFLCIASTRAVGDIVVATTTVATYEYNADGAPTAVTTQVDGGQESTLYLTWDNFVPDAADPTTGTVSPDNGNLAAAGDSPSSSTTVYRFDRRDRLVGYAAGAQALTYTYHPDGTMASSTSADGAGLSFYYDGGRLPRMLNMRQPSDGLWSAHLGPVRHVSDGSGQILIAPRKDTAGGFDADAQTLTPFRYDAFGAEAATTMAAATSYDLHDNPFRYAGEYTDAIWQGQYLRARWYDPQVPTFVSRDPLAHLNRYGYGDANPVMKTDPGGMKAGFFKAIARGVDGAVDWLGTGVQGHFARLLASPLLYPLEIVAHPLRFWRQTLRDPVTVAFLGVSLELGVTGRLAGASFAALEGQQSLVGSVQSVFSGFGDFRGSGHEHFDASVFVQSLESALGASLLHAGLLRGAAGARYNPFTLTVDELEARRASLADGEALIFRGREPRGGSGSGFTSPLLEAARLGNYHEFLVAVTSDAVYMTEHYFGLATFAGETVGDTLVDHRAGFGWLPINQTRVRFEAAGVVSDFDAESFLSNPRNLALAGEPAEDRIANRRSRFHPLRNNCHDHVHAILYLLSRQRR